MTPAFPPDVGPPFADRRQLEGGHPAPHAVRPHVAPMDLACQRVARWMPRRRGSDPVALNREEDCRIHLPNPRYPLPAPAPIRLHCREAFVPARAWGGPQPDALDVALNVMAAYLPFRIADRSGALRTEDGALVSRRAAALYRAFCADFLEPMRHEGGHVPQAAIRGWLLERADERELAA